MTNNPKGDFEVIKSAYEQRKEREEDFKRRMEELNKPKQKMLVEVRDKNMTLLCKFLTDDKADIKSTIDAYITEDFRGYINTNVVET